jgi:hypothetical protein
MRTVWRFLLSCRYLLMACVVVAVTFGYVLIPRPQSVPTPAAHRPAPLSLYDKYRQVRDKQARECLPPPGKGALTGPEVKEILGPPDETLKVFDAQVWVWRQGRETVTVWLVWGKPPEVLSVVYDP